MSDSKTGKIAIVLAKPKKKAKTSSATLENEFGATTTNNDTTKITQPERTSPLVIPLSQPTTGPLHNKLQQQEDAAAAQALMDSAARHYETQAQETGDTNFSANGISIATRENTFTRNKQQKDDDALQLQRDLQQRADNVTVDSSVYAQVPIAEFGAALLRGMGWKGDNDTTTKKKNNQKNEFTMPRPHRLGLGATPQLPDMSRNSNNKMKRPDQVQREQRLEQQQLEYQAKRDEQIRCDKQKTLQIGSIVYIQEKQRGKMVQLLGVPGLNQVLVQYEGDASTTSVKKSSVQLVSRNELEKRPYREFKQETSRVKREQHDDDDGRDRKRIKREDHESDNRQGRNDHDRSKDRNGRNGSKKDHRETKRRRTNESEDAAAAIQRWLIPNIRVRVVTKKLSSRQYKQKGLVLDVTHGGAYATLQMSDGQILDRVPERYLETALPKVGGNAIILTGKHGLEKGKLLERNSDSGQGVVQVFEDMNVVKLSLDDMAEWCGPLDDDMDM